MTCSHSSSEQADRDIRKESIHGSLEFQSSGYWPQVGKRARSSRPSEFPRHERALQIFMLIVLAHWAEHLAQAAQIYFLGWPRPRLTASSDCGIHG